MEETNRQKDFWDEMIQLRYELFYLDEYILESQTYDNSINIFTAFASSSSIAAWALWDSLKFLWSFIIALSQVINAIKIYLPFNKRAKVLTQLHHELSKLFIDFEYYWHKVQNGEVTETEINDTLKSLRLKKQKSNEKYLSQVYLPNKDSLIDKAKSNFEKYYS